MSSVPVRSGGPRHAAKNPHTTGLALNPSCFERSMSIMRWPLAYFRTEVVGAERMPEGAAMMVGNHGPFGLDAPLLVAAMYTKTGRAVRGMADRALFRSPRARRILRDAGVEEASGETAVALLSEGQWVMTYPGGAREVMRPPEQRYTLRWDGRTGSVRAALQAGACVVPVACIGIDDLYAQLRTQREVAETKAGRYWAKRVGSDFVAPLLLGAGVLPLPVKLTFHVGEPVRFAYGPDDAHDPRVLDACHGEMQARLEALLRDGLRARDAEADFADYALRRIARAIESRARAL